MAFNFNQYASEGNHFLKTYASEMDMGENREKAGRILVAILHALRDVISTEESLQFIAQLPMFLKASYVNGWSLKKKKKIKRKADFVERVKKYDGPAAVNDFEYSDELVENYVSATFIFLQKYVSAGEFSDIRDGLPKDLKPLIFSNIVT
ncbi:DUF2267 domain-containing protein [Poritiphilus flavus]|uniref:DUF2267 domain-containing protein n=1 Tax=Poritiphilus flavus TaxID=2697053 RepID=A0A6L9EAX8_9FLAO|nr:DUF2267 domain-containing protein [Poritiphilus flavus]NAS11917.1 DUF2267 domain-containing protein [Poritiphilus flavus]